jgi:hypothetical protein
MRASRVCGALVVFPRSRVSANAFWESCDFGCREAVTHDRRQRVDGGRMDQFGSSRPKSGRTVVVLGSRKAFSALRDIV